MHLQSDSTNTIGSTGVKRFFQETKQRDIPNVGIELGTLRLLFGAETE